ncbi:YaiI/YqxD family protein [Rhodanobacter aciditrophus]|uniref:YaiI/YqxD family protein n=1 Tax=Rhodanobacter aciditrophus TaxID=1623218 RepID=UPI003CE9541F
MSAGAQILVDADACPVPIKEILFRAAERERVMVILVANQYLRTPPSRFVRALQVPGGFDVADHEIAHRTAAGDLVVTQDIPLAAAVIDKGALALDPRGELHTVETIAQRLAMRNFMDELRGAGVDTGGHAPFHARDRQAFANQLDRWLQQRRT